jgi:hypothetical protein
MDVAETNRFGQGMGDMGSLWYDPNSPEFGPEFPGINQVLIAKAIDRMANSTRTDGDGFPLGFNSASGISNEELLFSAHAEPPTMEQIEAVGLADARNLNFSAGNGFGGTVGLLINDKNEVYWYVGTGGTTPGFSLSYTYSLDDFVPGHLSMSLSGGMGIWGSYDGDLYNSSKSYELGGGFPYSVSYMAQYVFPTPLFQLPQLSHPGPYTELPFFPAHFGEDWIPPGSMSIPEYPGWYAPGVDISRNNHATGLYK